MEGKSAVCECGRTVRPDLWLQSEQQATPLHSPVVRSQAVWMLSFLFGFVFCSFWIYIKFKSVFYLFFYELQYNKVNVTLFLLLYFYLLYFSVWPFLIRTKPKANDARYDRVKCSMTWVFFRIDLWPSGPVQRSCTSTGGKERGHVSCHYLNQISLHHWCVQWGFKDIFSPLKCR